MSYGYPSSYGYRSGYHTSGGAAAPPSPLLLDGISSTVWGAYSVNKLYKDYEGAALRVKDNSDVEEDIGFSGSELNIAALSGDTPYRVIRWYDQTGNNRDLTVGASNIPTLDTGQVAVRFNQSQFILPSLSGLTAVDFYLKRKIDSDPPSAGDGGIWFLGTSGGNSHAPTASAIYDDAGSNARKNGISYAGHTLTNYHVYSAYSAANDWANYIDDDELHQTGTNTVAFPATPLLGPGGISGVGIIYMMGHVKSFIILSQKGSSDDRTTLHTGL